ncbi:MAG: hypothetical protein M3071_07670 [Actinomycetota bacterium]|nr:hypothetical protein [Actinomycetota bacterium]
MPRLGKVISTSLLACTATLVLAVWASAAPPSAAARASCLPQGALTLAADRTAQVFSWHGSVYGCLDATGARQKLGGAAVCNLPPGHVAPVRLVGAIVAYGLEHCGVDTGSSTLVVRNLASARRPENLTAGTLRLGPETFVLVQSLVLRGDGAVGWIAVDESLVRTRRSTYEVHRFTGAKSSLLDSGTGIDPSSLRLVGSRMTWRDGTKARSASLS